MKYALILASIGVLLFSIGCGSSSPNQDIRVGSGSFLYVANADGTISGYVLDTGVPIRPVAGSPFSNPGSGPLSIVNSGGSSLFVANNGSGNISAYTYETGTGVLSRVTGSPFQALPLSYPHVISLAVCGAYLYSANDIAALSSYQIQSDGSLKGVTGSGQGALSTSASVAVPLGCERGYVSSSAANKIIMYPFSSGAVQWSASVDYPLPAGATTPVGLAIYAQTPSLQFLYTANAGSNNISGFAIDSTTGSLTQVPGSPFAAGAKPSSIFVYGPYLLVTNADANTVSVYTINQASGALTLAPGSPFATGTNPGAVTAGPAAFESFTMNTLVFVANRGSNNISIYSMASNGALQPIPGSPFANGSSPQALTLAMGLQ